MCISIILISVQKKYRLLWNSIISPRQSYDDCKSFSLDFKIIDIHLLFCKLSQTSDKDKFLANHFVLLINKSNYNLSVLKRCIEVSQHSQIKRPKKAVETV